MSLLKEAIRFFQAGELDTGQLQNALDEDLKNDRLSRGEILALIEHARSAGDLPAAVCDQLRRRVEPELPATGAHVEL